MDCFVSVEVTGARVEAMRAITKLRIDAHDLWLGD
jgi:hypothetical protein